MLPPDAPDPSIQHDPGAHDPGAHDPGAHDPGAEPAPAVAPLPTVTATTTTTPRRLSVLTLSIVLVALLAGSVLFLSGYSVGRQAAVEPGTPVSAADAFRPFWDTYDAITDRYAGGDVDRATIVQGAIRGMIDSLGDPYSSYLTSEQYRDSLLGISGQFEGVGAEIATRALDGTEGCAPLGTDCRLIVTRPLDGSPAAKAGVEAGDIVVAVDGTTLDGLTLDAAIERIRGPKGSVVTLTILRGTAAPIDIAITRDIVQSNEVDTKALANGTVGYIRLAGFSDAGADQVVAALKEHLAAGRTKLILDLRGNLGGYVTAARKIASQFIGSGAIFWEQDAQGNQVPTSALGDGVAIDPSIRLVVLIDGNSASASEIVAGALQDSKRAQLVGQQSFGKGTVQQWQELTGDGGAFKLTTARWLTPDKRWIHEVGLTPDVVVTLPDEIPAGMDPTLDRALEVLAGPLAAVGALKAAA